MRSDGREAIARAPLVVWLGEPRSTEPALVGHKAAHLSTLSRHFPVPVAFCVTTQAYRACAESLSAGAGLRQAIAEAYTSLAESSPAVAVRSSAADEDSADASFAGQLTSSLNVQGVAAVIDALETTWRSANSDAARAYRRSLGLDAAAMPVAVLVQRLVHADASGVSFSVDPVSADKTRIVVNATWGLGESLVNGSVDPDRLVADKATLSLISEELGAKERMTVPAAAGVYEVPTPSFLRSRPVLSPEERQRVFALTRDLELRLGWPVDVEFAIGPAGLSLLQCRPITTTGSEAEGSADQRRSNAVDASEDRV